MVTKGRFMIRGRKKAGRDICSGGHSPASQRKGPGSLSGQCTWNSWRTKWQRGQLFLLIIRFSGVNYDSVNVPCSFIYHPGKRKCSP
jgi:hypothetical protein